MKPMKHSDGGFERRTHMQQYRIQQAHQTRVLHDDKQLFIEEISALRSMAEVAGVAANLLAELEVFKHEVEQVDSTAWGRKEVRVCKRDDLVCLS